MPQTPEEKHAYYIAHREEILAKRAAYRTAHRETIRTKKAAAYRAHREGALAKQAAWYGANQGTAIAYRKTYQAAHRQEALALAKAYYATHREEILAKRSAKREAIRAYDKKYYATKRNERLAMSASWRKDHPQEMASHSRRRRARKLHAPVCDFTESQWEAMKEHYDHRCLYCPEDCLECQTKTHRLTQDHLTPLSKGGSHTLQNIVPCCAQCNSRKHVGPVLAPVQPMLL